MNRAAGCHVAPQFQPDLRRIGIDADAVFTHPDIKPWRSIADRENCTLDFIDEHGTAKRWHVKRYAPVRSKLTPAEKEVQGVELLIAAGIPTIGVVAWGVLSDRRSFVIIEHLESHRPSDKLLDAGASFEKLLQPTAHLAADLHRKGLHHRDLYLCHFSPIDHAMISTFG